MHLSNAPLDTLIDTLGCHCAAQSAYLPLRLEEIEGELESWYIDTDANFEVVSGGEDGLLADGDYEFEYTTDGRLTCKNTRTSKLHSLQRCRDGMKTRF
ncbi:hypothetical protein [Chroococcidiopsis sp. CCMEE 29]|uniref:hypothetical protein n=1 Tax=Chroococcidiopsis sp. CCMEE 29 TaxID=155894 RepID=UPI0020213FBF|nr:hypothetical protein [Chroococcidiopsis sp. CCMEE 29]